MTVGKPTRIVIPTTRAPSNILRLAREDARIGRSTVCLGGSTRQAGIDNDYNAFVREPTGVVEKFHGHAAFRLDISEPIDAGLSWQLAAFLAHAMEVEGALHSALDAPDSVPARTIWATGAVDTVGLRLSPVGHIEVKARQVLASEDADMFLMPFENAADLPPLLRDAMQARGIAVHTPRTAVEALNLLGIEPGWLASASNAQNGVGGVRVSWTGKPYRGLEHYDAEHRAIFFGRARAREEAVERLRRNAARGTGLLVVHGTSGVGKSSLVLAGLKGDIVDQAQEGAPWAAATIRFGGSAAPEPALWSAIAGAVGGTDAPGPDPVARLATLLDAAGKSHLLLILDQFEQALSCPQAELDALAATLVALARSNRAWLVATLRTDRMELLERAPVLARIAEGDALYRLAPPTLSELGQIIRAPAAMAGYRFETAADEDDLADRLAQIALGAPDSLPLLQIVLMRLAEHAGTDRLITVAAYERFGGFEGAVGRWAEETVTALTEAGTDPAVIDLCLASLVRVDEHLGRADARVIASADLPSAQRTVIDAFVSARLASLGQGGNVRLVHETLIRDWPRLSDLVVRLRDDLALRDRLESAAILWSDEGRPDTDLIRTATRLEAVETLLGANLVSLSPVTEEYVAASRAAIERDVAATERARVADLRRSRRIATGAIITAVLVTGLAAWAWSQRNAATQQALLAEAAATEAAAAQSQTEEALADLRRQLRYREILEAEEMVAEGDVDKALLMMLNASEAFLEPELQHDVAEDILIAFESAIRRATYETRYQIPADAAGFGFGNRLYYQVPSEGTLWRARHDGPPERIGMLEGQVLDVYDLMAPVGPVLAVAHEAELRFHRFDPETGAGDVLLVLSRDDERAQWDISVGPDGVVTAAPIVPEDVLRRENATVPATYLARLDTGSHVLLPIGGWRIGTRSGGGSYLSTFDQTDIDAARKLGVEAVLADNRIGLETSYLQCLGAAAAGPHAAQYEKAILAVSRGADQVRCKVAGDHMVISNVQNTSAGPIDTLHLINVRFLEELEDRVFDQTLVDTQYDWNEGISLALAEDRTGQGIDQAELVYYSFRDLTLHHGAGSTLTLRMLTPIETAVATGDEGAAVILSPERNGQSKKTLVMVDRAAGDAYGRTDLGRGVEPVDPASAEGRALGLLARDDPWRQQCVSLNPEDGPPTSDKTNIFNTTVGTHDITLPVALLLDEGACVVVAPSGVYAGVWRNGAIEIYHTEDGTQIATYTIDREPRDFVFFEGELIVADRNSIIVKILPKVSTYLDIDGNFIETRMADDIGETGTLLRTPEYVVDLSLAPTTDRMLYAVSKSPYGFEIHLNSIAAGRTWRILGRSSNFFDAYFLKDNTIFIWDGRSSFLHHLPNLQESRNRARAALSDHCIYEGRDVLTSACAIP